MTALAENLEQLEEAIRGLPQCRPRRREEVELMAVSKTYPAADDRRGRGAGARCLARTACRSSLPRRPELAGRTPRRMQGCGGCTRSACTSSAICNRTRRRARSELFDGIDSVDSLRLAERLNEAAGKLGKRLPVLIEVKLSPEETKAGLDPESGEAAALLERLPDLAHLETRGLMTIAPWGVAEEITRACFRSLRDWRDRWAAAHPRFRSTCSPWA